MAMGLTKRSLLGLVAGAVMSLGLVMPTLAVEVDGGTVEVDGNNTAKLIVSISTDGIDFGTINPDGLDSVGTTDFLDPAGAGAAYVANTGVTVTIQSNLPWIGKIAAEENSGTSLNMTLANLRYTHADGDSGSPATSYAEATGAPSIAFDTVAQDWDAGSATQSEAHTDHYALRVDWTNNPGTFSTVVTYSVTQ